MANQHSEQFIKHFTRDPRMVCISNSQDIHAYTTYVESLFRWNDGVSDDVKNHFEVVKSLLVYSFYNYILIDEAVKKALFAYELAMKIRYYELTGKKWNKKWVFLINELYKMSLFDDNLESIQHDREKRNFFAHPEGSGFGGVAFWNVIKRVVDNINGMYDNVEKRKARIGLTDEFNSFVEGKLKEGFEVNFGNKKLLGHEIYCLWINNRGDNPRYNLLVYYCTTDDFLKLDDAKDLPKDLLVIENITFSENELTGLLVNSRDLQKTITFSKAEQTIKKVQEWKSKFESSTIKGDYNAYKFVRTEDQYKKCKREYLYME